VNGVQPDAGRVIKVFAGAAPDLFVGRTDIDHLLPANVGDPEHFVDVFGNLAKFLLAFAQ
jgi:hypothetical protein